MDPKTKRCIFLGYGETTEDFRLYCKEKRRVFYSRVVAFNEANSSRNQINGIKNDEVINKPVTETECQ